MAGPYHNQGYYSTPQYGASYSGPNTHDELNGPQQYAQGGYRYDDGAGTSSHQGYGQYQGNPNYGQQHAGHQQQQPQYGYGDNLVSDFAAGMLKQQGENYFQRGQAFVQSRMSWLSFLSSNSLQYLFNIDGSYVRDKLLLLLMPFLKQKTFARKAEQISGGHRYQPPRQDVYAPDLYIPFMSICTYVILISIMQLRAGKFSHDNVYITVSSSFTGWLLHWAVIKAVLWALSIGSAVPFLEMLAYAGYSFVYACLGLIASFFGGLWPYRLVLAYGGLAMGTFIVRTMKHVIFHDAPHYSKDLVERIRTFQLHPRQSQNVPLIMRYTLWPTVTTDV